MLASDIPSATWSELTHQFARSIGIRDAVLPPYPAVGLALERLLAGGASLSELCALIEVDAGLTAAVLRRASSLLVTGSLPPLALETAIYRIGFDDLRELLRAACLGGAGAGPLALLRREQWMRSLCAATVCRELAERRGISTDLAYLAGLLHGFAGMVALAAIEARDDLPDVPMSFWRRVILELQQEAELEIARSSNLPPPIVEAIAHFRAPSQGSRIHRPLIQLVATVHDVITRLEQSPSCRTAQLDDIPGIDHDERFRICALLPRVTELMSSFEADTSTGRCTANETPATVPCSVVLTNTTGGVFRAVGIGDQCIVLRSRTPLSAGWLVELTIELPTLVPITVTVDECDLLSDGTFSIIARPFGLDRAARATWIQLVARGQQQLSNQES